MNILNGDSAAGLFRQAFDMPSENMMVFRDVLSCGPIKPFKDEDSWVLYREEYWHRILADNDIEPYSFHGSHRDLFACFEELKNVEEIRLWIGSSLSDQLLLAFLVSLLVQHNIDPSKLSVFQFYKLDGLNYEIHGIGLLHPDNIKRYSEPIKLSKEMIGVCLDAWNTVIDTSPESLIAFLNRDTTDLPLMSRAMSRLLYRYPSITNGLTYWDEALLSYVTSSRRKAARIIGGAMCHDKDDKNEWADRVGDLSLFSWLKDLARPTLAQPLIEMSSMDFGMRETEVNILQFGVDVKEGRENKVKANGINDWVGGVHLESSSGGTWFRKNETLVYESY